jgi:glycerol-3-phosphate acyltransferase PlsY
MIYSLIISVIISYLLGSVNTAIIVSKLLGQQDIRQKGSGNAGATNTLRVLGAKAAVMVVIGDALKGIIAVLISRFIAQLAFGVADYKYCMYASSVAVVLGHVFPLYFGFKGGKGIMTAISVIFVLDWKIGIILVLIFAVFIALFNYVSLSSCVCAFCYPFIVLFLYRGNVYFFISALVVAIIAICKHRTNIKRLISGTESKLFKSKKSEVK